MYKEEAMAKPAKVKMELYEGAFLVTKTNVFIPVNRVYCVDIYELYCPLKSGSSHDLDAAQDRFARARA